MLKNRPFRVAILVVVFLLPAIGKCNSLSVEPGRQPYTSETTGHLLAYIDGMLKGGELTFKAMFNDTTIVKEQPVKAQQRLIFDIDLEAFPQGKSDVVCYVTQKGNEKDPCVAHATIIRVAPRTNATKVDFIRRCLLFDDEPVFPFGFYCNADFNMSLPKDEIIHGFNMISPYRHGLAVGSDKSTKKTLEYLDLCASIGMKVVYDLRPIAERKSSEEKFAKLKAELEMIGNHPAILCWIISDEPADKQLDPQPLIETYEFIKKIDPYHPVTIVFCHYVLMHKYMDAMDFVLLDYYPVPNHPVSMVSDMLGYTRDVIGPFMPLWLVPQAFGGSWTWSREPSAKELQVMTYLGLTDGVSGINYFIRRPEIENPISPLLWASCRRMAAETAQLAPALLSDQSLPEMVCSESNVRTTIHEHKGHYTILATNIKNEPCVFKLQVNGSQFTGKADVLFENRQVDVEKGSIEEMIDAFGTRAYRFRSDSYVADDISIDPTNLIVNPSFEHSVNAGTPDGCYVGRSDSPATISVDPWQSRHGLHSMRLTAPIKGSAIRYTASPIPVEKGQLYRFSIWAKAQKEGMKFKVSSGLFDDEFDLTKEWEEYTITGTAKRTSKRNMTINILFTGEGAAWFDLLQVVPLTQVKEF